MTVTHKRFRKKPAVVDAVLWDGTSIEAVRALDPRGDGDVDWFDVVGDHLEIRTRDGIMWARLGDWVVKGVNGAIYPCRRAVFEATYEPALDGLIGTGSLARTPDGFEDWSKDALLRVLRQALNEAHAYRENLASVQGRCTELLEETRTLRREHLDIVRGHHAELADTSRRFEDLASQFENLRSKAVR